MIVDTDPGGDDVLALLWLQSLVQQGLAELVAVTAAAGNIPATRTFTNVSQLLRLGGLSHLEVGRGVAVPDAAVTDAAHLHGADGMGSLSATLPATTHVLAEARYAAELLIDMLSAAPGEITLVAIAPLTNLAAAEAKRPGILKKAREIVLMAGAFTSPGNVTPQAEFNIFYNPEAAHRVLHSRAALVVLPLDVTTHLESHFVGALHGDAVEVPAHPHRCPWQVRHPLQLDEYCVLVFKPAGCCGNLSPSPASK